ncbi:MAG: DUF4192 domain-containing protein, partial [Actinobacteria bacterium]|nr:DUF4192 domain-containing protein [Actinomycetota bacterium]
MPAAILDAMTEPAQKLRLSSPRDVVEVVPYVLGFHPRNSLVGLALRGTPRRIVFTLRLDLPAPADPQTTARLAAGVRDYLANARARQAVLVVYGDSGDVLDGLPHADLVAAVTQRLADR